MTSPTPQSPDTTEPSSYAAAQAELEDILERLNSDEVDVDQLAESVERGAFLISWSRKRIAGAQLAIERTVAELDAAYEQSTTLARARPGSGVARGTEPQQTHDDNPTGANAGDDTAETDGDADGTRDARLGRPSELFDDEPF